MLHIQVKTSKGIFSQQDVWLVMPFSIAYTHIEHEYVGVCLPNRVTWICDKSIHRCTAGSMLKCQIQYCIRINY